MTVAPDRWFREEQGSRLACFLRRRLPELSDVSAHDVRLRRLPGGAVQESWLLQAGSRQFVLRTDGATSIPASGSRQTEFEILAMGRAGGVDCPEPIVLEASGKVLGRPFFLMSLEPGSTDPDEIVSLNGGAGAEVAASLAKNLARLHRIPPQSCERLLGKPPEFPQLACLKLYRTWLLELDDAQPVLDWALNELERVAPTLATSVLCHRDFRTGNYLVTGDPARLQAILDWEFAGWSDPYEDLGWFCCRSWRFERPDREAGGIASRSAFLAAYQQASGFCIDPARLEWWEAMASLRWGLIACQQRDRMRKRGERSLDLALTAYRVAECEWDLLRLLGGEDLSGVSDSTRTVPAWPSTELLLSLISEEFANKISSVPSKEGRQAASMIVRGLGIAARQIEASAKPAEKTVLERVAVAAPELLTKEDCGRRQRLRGVSVPADW